jgi:hypothetical protein
MAAIEGEKPLMSNRQIASVVVSLLVGGAGVMWAVLNFTVGGLRDDVSAIRNDIGKLQDSAITAPTKLSDAQLALTRDISDLRKELETYHGDLKVINVSLENIIQNQKSKK